MTDKTAAADAFVPGGGIDVYRVTAWEDASLVLLRRVILPTGIYAVKADISSITASVFDLSGTTSETASATATLTVNNVMFDSLQEDDEWTTDTVGYNFRYTTPTTWFSTGGHRYRVEVKFTDSTSAVFWAVWEVYAKPQGTS